MAVAAGCGLPLFWLFKRPIIGVLNKLFIIDQDASFREFGRSVATGLVLLAVYALVFFLLRRSKGQARILGWALIALAVLDPAYHNRYVNPTVPASFYDTPPLPGLLAAPLAIYRDELYSPFLKETMGDNIKLLRFFRKSLYPFTGLGDGIRYVFNWDFYGTYSRRYLDLREAIKGLPPNGQFKVLKYIGCAAHIGYEPLFSRESAQRLQIEGVNVWLERIAETGASPFIAFRAVRAAKVRDKLGIFAGDGFDPLKEIVTEKDIILPDTLGNTDMKAGAVLIRKEVQGRGWYSASLPYEGIAVFPGNAAPGWHARIDGRRAEVFEANLFAKGVLVPAGEHEIVLRYLPASFLWGVVISLVSIGLVPAGVCILGRRPKGKARTALLVLFYIVLVILITPFIAFCMLTGLRDPLIAVGQWAMRVSRRILGIKVEVSGLDRIDPRTTLIFMPNHMSFLDGPLVMMLIPGAARVILKKSVLRLPVVGLGMRHVGFVPVDRKGIDGGKKSVARAASLMRERGYSFLVFPEGTRSRDGTLGAFRRGGFFLAVASGAPIVPVTIRGTRELMPKGQWFARRGTVKVAFHDPIPVTGYAADTMAGLMERVREAIVSAEGPAVGVKESARVSDSVTAVSSYRKAGLESEQGGREHENKAEKS
jgi:1-acyl-sn-glycerol-3-phosphate acyltransferase